MCKLFKCETQGPHGMKRLYLETHAMIAGRPCKLWTEETSCTLNTRAKKGLPKCMPEVQTQPAMVPITSAPPGWTIKLQQVPMATPPASVAFWQISIISKKMSEWVHYCLVDTFQKFFKKSIQMSPQEGPKSLAPLLTADHMSPIRQCELYDYLDYNWAHRSDFRISF